MITKILIIIGILIVLGLVSVSLNKVDKDSSMNNRINKSNSLLVDVREKDEYSFQHFEGSVNIPLSEIQRGKYDQIKNTKLENIVLVCRSGNRAGMAEQILKQAGVSKNIVNLGTWENLKDLK